MNAKQPLRRRITPSVPYTLNVEDADGSKFSLSFRLSYDLNALSLVEEVLGKSLLTDLGALIDKPSITSTTVLLWAALRENHAEYGGPDGLDAIRSLLTIGEAKNALSACLEAFMAQLPAEKRAEIKAAAAAAEKAAAEGKPAPLEQSPTAASA